MFYALSKRVIYHQLMVTRNTSISRKMLIFNKKSCWVIHLKFKSHLKSWTPGQCQVESSINVKQVLKFATQVLREQSHETRVPYLGVCLGLSKNSNILKRLGIWNSGEKIPFTKSQIFSFKNACSLSFQGVTNKLLCQSNEYFLVECVVKTPECISIS